MDDPEFHVIRGNLEEAVATSPKADEALERARAARRDLRVSVRPNSVPELKTGNFLIPYFALGACRDRRHIQSMPDDSERTPAAHEPPLSVQERLQRYGYDWRGMTTIGIDAALREIRNREDQAYPNRVEPTGGPDDVTLG